MKKNISAGDINYSIKAENTLRPVQNIVEDKGLRKWLIELLEQLAVGTNYLDDIFLGHRVLTKYI